MEGNSNASAQTIAMAWENTRTRRPKLSGNQCKRHTAIVASVTASQSKLRVVSIILSYY
jgi:hypothetical protein